MPSYLFLISVLIVLPALSTFSTTSTEQCYQQLQQEALILNITRVLAENLTSVFLTTGNLSLGTEVYNLTLNYIVRKRLWIYKTQNCLKNNSVLQEGNRLNYLYTEMKQMETYLLELQDVLDISAAANSLCQNITNMDFNVSATMNSSSLEKIQQCSKQLIYFENTITLLGNKWNCFNITSQFVFPWSDMLNIVEEKQQYLFKVNATIQQKQFDISEKLKLTHMFQYYVYPIVYAIILTIGTIGNGTFFFIFFRHKKIRTNANIMVLNLAIADVLNLFVNAPVYYMIKYHNDNMYRGCKVFAVFRFLTHALIELSVVAISGQRYFATVSALHVGDGRWHLTPRARIVVHITIVWILSLIIALFPVLFVFDFPNGICYPVMRYENWALVFYISTFVFDGLILPILLFAFSLLTANILKRSAREIPSELRNSEQELARYRGARVVTALAIAYIVCFIPRCVLSFVVSSQHLQTNSEMMMYLDEVTNYMIFSNSCLNPIALYMASRSFRRLFNSYLCPCYRGKESGNLNQRTTDSRITPDFRTSVTIER